MSLTIGVAGAGIGGLAFCALAARLGHKVFAFDQVETPQPVGSGLVIQPVGQAVLHAIGVGDQAKQLGQMITRMLGHEARSGREVLNVNYDPQHGQRFGLAIHRASLFNLLLEAAASAGITLLSGQRVTGRAGKYLLLENKREGPFDLIVDASGAKSPLSPLITRPLEFGAIWGTVPWPSTTLPLHQLSQCYRRADRMVGVLPVGRLPNDSAPLASIFWSLTSQAYAAWQAQPLAQWRHEAIRLWAEFEPFLETIDTHNQMTMAIYSHGTLATPVGERIAHIGDAAHRASPQLGQGANMALLDAFALAHALRHPDLNEALWGYVKSRRFHVSVYQAISAAFTPQYQSNSRSLPLLRDYVLNPIARIPPFPRVLSRLVCGDLVPPFGNSWAL